MGVRVWIWELCSKQGSVHNQELALCKPPVPRDARRVGWDPHGTKVLAQPAPSARPGVSEALQQAGDAPTRAPGLSRFVLTR